MKDLPKKKKVAKMEQEDEFLTENPLKSEEKFFDKKESRLKRMLRAIRVKKPKIKKVKPVVGKRKPAKNKVAKKKPHRTKKR